ncbi:MAG: AMP-binding protein [Bdellovibrionales bacterium]|nr:AMP-binding protein [Bdellovibrionales bacterium]
MKFDFNSGKWLEMQTRSEALAVIGTDRQLTWAALAEESAKIAAHLTHERVQGHPVLIYGHKEAGMISCILACLQARVPYIPIDTIVPAARVQAIRQIAGSTLALCPAGARVDGTFCLSVPQFELSGQATAPEAWQGADDLAYIIFTSGSSGEPKGVQIQRANVNDLAAWTTSDDFAFSREDVILNQCSFSFDVSFFDTVSALQTGACLILSSPNELKRPRPFSGAPEGYSPTVWSSTPSFLSLALTAPGFDGENFPRLRRFYVAGEVVHKSLAQRLWKRFPNGELWNAYGPTEATVITTLVHVTPEIVEKYPTVPIGRVKPGVAMPTTASDGESEGELWIVGANVSPGYLNRPDLNQTRFATKNGQRAYLTGDLGYHRDGLVFYQGRVDSQIKLHGYRIELEEIDSHVASVHGVDSAATIGLQRDGDVKKLVCFVKCKPDAPANVLDRVREDLGKTLPYYMIPADFRRIDEIPHNTNHKVDRVALAKILGL